MAFSSKTPKSINRALILGKIESAYNVYADPVPASDALYVSNPDVRIESQLLDRNVVRPSLSKAASVTGRKTVTMSFTHELKGSGVLGTAPAIGKLLKACGMAQTTVADTAAATVASIAYKTGASAPAQAATFTKQAASDVTGRYVLSVVKGGASGTAKLRVTGIPATPDASVMANEVFGGENLSNGGITIAAAPSVSGDYSSLAYTIGGTFAAGEQVRVVVGGERFEYTTVSGDTNTDGVATAIAALIDADARFAATASGSVITVTFATNSSTTKVQAIVVTSGSTDIPVGNSGAVIRVTWSGSLVQGDSWDILVLEPGVHYTPVSGDYDSISLYMNRDGLLHRATGCMGSFSIAGEAGNYASVSFTFTGQFVEVIDEEFPTGAVYEASLPDQVENAMLALNGFDDFCAQSFSVDIQNQVSVRECMNNSDGFNGVTITDRNPTGSMNPEATSQADFNLWERYADSLEMPFHVKVGSEVGNTVRIIGDNVQISSVSYSDRNRTLVTDLGLGFKAWSGDGDDELRLVFI